MLSHPILISGIEAEHSSCAMRDSKPVPGSDSCGLFHMECSECRDKWKKRVTSGWNIFPPLSGGSEQNGRKDTIDFCLKFLVVLKY